MENIPFGIFLPMSTIDNLLVFYLGLGLTRIDRPLFRQLLSAALINALFSFVIRNLPLAPGIHLLFQVPFIIVTLRIICHLPLLHAMLAAFIGVIFLLIIQTIMGFLLTGISGIPFQTYLSTTALHLVLTIPNILGCLLAIFIIYNWKIVLIDINTLDDGDRGKGFYNEED